MKKTRIFAKFLAIGLLAFATISCDRETVLKSADVPIEIKSYIEHHFPAYSIIRVVEDKETFSKTYDVFLDNNFKLEFSSKAEILEISGNSKLPDSVIPSKIMNYVSSNYPKNDILKWKIDGRKQEVKLSGDIEIDFNKNGDFVKVD